MRRSIALGLLCPVLLLSWTSAARAAEDGDEVTRLRAEVRAMQGQQAKMEDALLRLDARASAPPRSFLELKPGNDLTLLFPYGEVTLYGNLDVSFDASTKGIAGFVAADGSRPAGRVGWMPDVSTNISYVGVKGRLSPGGFPIQLVYQLETQLDVASTSGAGNSNSQSDTTVKGALTSRNSFIGIDTAFGSLKFGKIDSPYKVSTARLNPFAGMWGDNAAIMGNTGGDNRVEFGTRLDHSLWYESPSIAGLRLAVLFSPGQNRGSESDQIAAGESSCTGGNIPGSGGTVPVGCTDGGWDYAFAASLTFERGGFYAAAAYERHAQVNRTSDLATLGATGMLVGYDPRDVADEDAMKLGAQYRAPWGTTVSGIFERMNRYVPSALMLQNERSRFGSWLSLSQEFLGTESVHLGWAHAMRTPGDPGQHNTGPASGLGTPGADNEADMLTIAYKHQLGHGVAFYANYAVTLNRPYAHYDLGAGGRAVTTDCHDAELPALGDTTGSPRCWAGGHLQGASVGVSYRF